MNNVNVKAMEWNSQSAVHLLPACDDTYTLNDVAFDVQKNKVSLFGVFDGENHIASMILRVDGEGQGRELVVVAIGGQTVGQGLIQSLSNFWDRLAAQNGIANIRAHVSRKGMMRLMERVGGKLTEYVYRKEVHHGW